MYLDAETVVAQSVQVIVGIAGGHVLAAAWDQFVGNVMRGEGELHQVGGHNCGGSDTC